MLNFHWSDNLDSVQREQWTRFLESSPSAHYRQSLPWARLGAPGHQPSYFWAERDKELVCVALCQSVPTGLRARTVMRVGRGPVCDDLTVLPEVMRELARGCRQRGGMRLEVDPYWYMPSGAQVERILEADGYSPRSRTGYSTLLVDLAPTYDEILASFRQTTRHEIFKFARRGGQIKKGEEMRDLSTFLGILEKTPYHALYEPNRRNAHVVWEELLAGGKDAILLLSCYQGNPVGGIVVVKVGRTAWYAWGASRKEYKHEPLLHALQWEAIRWAKQQGCAYYDLGGGRSTRNLHLPPGGIRIFKSGFSHDQLDFVRVHRKVLRPVSYAVWQQLSALKQRIARASRSSG